MTRARDIDAAALRRVRDIDAAATKRSRATATHMRAREIAAAKPAHGRTIVFVGPTLPAAEVAAALVPVEVRTSARAHAEAEVRGPVAVGDVLRLADAPARARPWRIAIVDGYFERMAAVWHKEILVALDRGIAVYGAASMGALRAAELAPFGMIAVGGIARDFARGALVADDEVAVAHLPAEQGYRPISDALVNLRHGLALALRRRAITAATHAALVDLARGLFYRDRTWARLVADGAAAGLPRAQLAALAASPHPDRKAADARALLRLLRTTPPPRRPATSAPTPRTWALDQLRRALQS